MEPYKSNIQLYVLFYVRITKMKFIKMQDYEKSRRFLNDAKRRPLFHGFKIRRNVNISRKAIEQFRD